VSNEKPIKLNMSFKQALEMIAKGGKPPPAIPKPTTTPKPPKGRTKAKKP
jgi:hypothetical protein